MQQGDAKARQRLTRALSDVTTAETPGLVPPQVTGPVVGQWMTNRPSIDSYAKPPLPAVGMEVQRPHISQHVLVNQQATEKTPVASQQFKLDLLKADLKTWAGAVDVSWQLVERSSPAAIDLIFSDFVAVYARYTDLSAVIRPGCQHHPDHGLGRHASWAAHHTGQGGGGGYHQQRGPAVP